MKVLVTGGSGFIGGHVVRALKSRGIQPIVFDRRREWPMHGPEVGVFLGDIRDATAVGEAVALVDGVIHLAGVLGTAETVDDPRSSFETNVAGSLNLFQAARRYGKRVTYITVGNYWYLNSYSITKSTAEAFAWMFNREHGTEIAVVRALNAYGPGQKAEPVRKIMPNFALAALRDEDLTVYGDGEQVMDMIYVGDLADILVRALLTDHGQYRPDPQRNEDNPLKFEAGTGRHTTVNEIAEEVIRQAGGGRVRHLPMRAGEPERSVVVGNPETLRPLYDGAVPALLDLEEGVSRTLEYYRATLGSKVPA